MRHNQLGGNVKFVEEPIEFDKHTDKELLAYCLGAALYMPALKDFATIIKESKIPGLTSMVVCFEDALDEADVPRAQTLALANLSDLRESVENGSLDKNKIPLIFFRVRNTNQFKEMAKLMSKENVAMLTGFVFPKFGTVDGREYFATMKEISERTGEPLYGMPILESRKIAHKETRMQELLGIKEILDENKDVVLNVRVGATDFSSCFAVRRGIDYSIYDILPVQDCLLDILNVFTRDNDYIVSGPVWEYFLASKEKKFETDLDFNLQSSLLKRKKLINEAIDGLLREVLIDRANGFIGKTVIHPTHVKFVNAMHAVTREEYEDVKQILEASGGVVKSPSENKMNEINPHRSWARKVYSKAKVYGVIEDETEFLSAVAKS
jgi:citrate lyase beta subunit